MAPDPRPEVFTAISHPARRRILDLLAEEDLPVNAIAGHFEVSRPAISQHLRILLDAGLVSERRHGRERRYRLVPEELAAIYGWLAHYQRFWNDRFRSHGEQLSTPAPPEPTVANHPPSGPPSPSQGGGAGGGGLTKESTP